MALDGDDDDDGIKVNLQLVGSEAGPGSLRGLWLVNLLFSGHGPLHVHAVSCSNETICILKLREIKILVFQCVKLMIEIFSVSVFFFFFFKDFLYYQFFKKNNNI